MSPTTQSKCTAVQRVDARGGLIRNVLQYEDGQLGIRALHHAA